MPTRLRRVWPTDPQRSDAALALALLIPSVVQVLVAPIAAAPVGVLIAVGSTVPVAWHRSHPVPAAVAGSLPWIIPTDDAYLVLGYVAAFLLYFSVAAHVADRRQVLGTFAFGALLTTWACLANGAILGEWVGAYAAIVFPMLAGRVVRQHREQARRLEELTALLD